MGRSWAASAVGTATVGIATAATRARPTSLGARPGGCAPSNPAASTTTTGGARPGPHSDIVIESGGPGLRGRDRALGRMAELRRRTALGVGGVVLVAGEAGIGKTALCEAVLVDAKRDSWTIAWASASQAAVVPGLWPWRQLLSALDGAELPAPPDAPGDPAAARVAQFDAVVRRVTDAGRATPVLAVLDDAHWADPATVALVLHAAATARQGRVCLLVTFRPEDAPPGSPLGAVLPGLRRLGTEIVLDPLARDDVAALACDTGGSGAVAESDVDLLVEVTGGNPLFVMETVRLLAGRSPRELDALPSSPAITATIAERVARLPAGCRDALGLASAIGARFDAATLAAVTGSAVPVLLGDLDEAVRAAIVQERGPGWFAFRHPLLRSAVYDGLGTAGRAGAHARLAAVLEAARAAGRPVELAVLAHHFGRSAPLGNAAPAARYALAAGDEAMAALAYETAGQRYGQALAALELAPGAGDRVDVLLRRAAADAAAGHEADARAGYQEAAARAAAAGRPVDLARAALGCSGGAGMEVNPDEASRRVLERALAAIGEREPALRARLLARLSVVVAATAPARRRAALVAEAGTLAAAAGDPLALADAAVARCHLHAGPDAVDRRLADAAAVVRHAVAERQTRLELLGRRLRIEALFEQGRVSELHRAVDEYEQRAAMVRDPAYTCFTPLWRATLAAAGGDEAGYHRHRATLAGVVEALPAGSDGRLLMRVQELFHLLDVERDGAAAARHYREAVRVGRAGLPPQLAVTEALLLAVEGRPDEARAVLARWDGPIRSMARDAEWIPALVQLADVASHVGEHGSARWVAEMLEPYRDLWAVEGIGAALRGPVSRALAVLADVLDAPPGPAGTPGAAAARLAFDAGSWFVEFDGSTGRVRDSKGMRDIAVLLARPGMAVAALDLVAAGGPVVVERALGPVLDAAARSAYRRRVAELDAALDAADRSGEAARSADLTDERDHLLAQLAAATGLGGRDRSTGSSAERARTTVTTRVKDALRRLDAAHPDAARHLRRALRTGRHCSYDPDPPRVWDVSLPAP